MGFNIFNTTSLTSNSKSGGADGAKKSSFFSKKRIYPSDSICSDNISSCRTRVGGLKLATPFILLIIVCIIASII